MCKGENYKVCFLLYAISLSVFFLLESPSLVSAALPYQHIYLSPADVNKSIGSEFTIYVMYDVSDGNQSTAGVGIRIHYDSSKLEFLSYSNLANLSVGSPLLKDEDPMKTDQDPDTDKMIVIGWVDVQQAGGWPNQPLPFNAVQLTFKVNTGIDACDTSINAGFTSVATGYYGKSDGSTIHVITTPTVFWTAESQIISENDGNVDITAKLSYTSANDVTIPITVSGTADAVTDFIYSEQSITIPSGQLSSSQTITIVDDAIIEPDETIIITMGTPVNASVDIPNVQTITIQNDDNGHFSTPINSTPFSIIFYGDNFQINGELSDVGDEIGVFDPDGILCGRAIIEVKGIYGITVFADDPESADIDEGAEGGDELTFKVWDVSENTEVTVTSSMFIPEIVYGANASPYSPPKWTSNNDLWGLNIHVTSSVTQRIPLKIGWNLFSFSINKVFYDSASPPTVETLSNAEFVKVTSLKDVLTSIDGHYDIVRNFDENGPVTFNPSAPSFINKLHYLASGYGYWIKMNQESTLILSGSAASSSDKILLKSGWNLIGCWHTDAQYDSATAPAVSIPENIQFTKVTSLSDIFYSINGDYSIIRNFDENGPVTYNPAAPSFINKLHYISPGYGYWIKIIEPIYFNY